MVLPKVAVVIINWNGLADTLKCLESLTKISYLNYLTIVVDNASNNNEGKEIKKKFSQVHLVQNSENLGFAEGNNMGIIFAEQFNPDYYLMLNNDTIVDRNFLTKMVNTAESNSKIGAVGAKVFFMTKPDRLIFFGLNVNLSDTRIDSVGYDGKDSDFISIQQFDYVGGSCILLRKTALEQVGLLDERFFAYFEETDLCFRLKEAGYIVVSTPKAKIWHNDTYPPIEKRGSLQNYLITRNRLLFTRKRHFSPFVIYFFKTLGVYFIIPILKSIKHKKMSDLKAYIFGYYDFLIGDFSQKRVSEFIK